MSAIHLTKDNFKSEIEEYNGRNRIVITEIPYQVNKAKLIITDENKRFTSFVILCFKEHYTTGRLITIAPKYNSTELVLATNPVEKGENILLLPIHSFYRDHGNCHCR